MRLAERERLKAVAANYAATLVESGMVVGLGSGTTAELAIRALAERMRQGLLFQGVPTSLRSARLARRLGIPLLDPGAVTTIDMVIDGADEVEPQTLALIKGHGGALVREKLVASLARRRVIVIDPTKLVDQLGTRSPVPVEVVPFAWQYPARALTALGGQPQLRRKRDGTPFRSDNGNYILDVYFGPIADPAGLATAMKVITGVVDHGLFLNLADLVIVGEPEGVRTLQK